MTYNLRVVLVSTTLIGLVRYLLHSYQQDSTLEAMLNCGMETTHNHQGTLVLFLSPELKEEKWMRRVLIPCPYQKLSPQSTQW